MKISDFKKIDQHFASKGKSISLAHMAYSTFIDNVEAAIKAQSLQHLPLSDPAIAAICGNYLTDAQLDSLVVVTEKRNETLSSKHSGLLSFGANVGASIVANIVFAIIIFGLYAYLVTPSDPASMKKALHGEASNQQ